jgi:hypothetical protein
VDFLAVDFYDAGIGLVQSEEDAHQRGFPGAVLPEQGVDLPFSTCNVTLSLARIPGKSFVISSISMTYPTACPRE